MKVALIGLQQSGKSTILSAITGKLAPMTGSTDIHEQVVPVPDERLDWLNGVYQPNKVVRATIDCLDLPGVSFVDEHGRAAARKLFGNIRIMDMFVLVVRAFKNDSVAAYRDRIDPIKDVEELRTEFLLADLEMVTTRIERLEKQVHKPTKTQAQDKAELELQLKLQKALESEQPISSVISNDIEREIIKPLGFLTLKPMMVVINVGEGQLDAKFDVSKSAGAGVEAIQLCAGIESELALLDPESRKEFMADMGLEKPASIQFVQSCYKTLGLISFLTVGKDEVRAWPIPTGISALDAAGKIHSDIKRGFIRAETMAYSDLKQLGDEKAVKAAGKMRLEGKAYVVQDGDIINFRFNV
jgi:GTP-binding protein YchF